MIRQFKDFYEAWVFLEDHKIFRGAKLNNSRFHKCLYIMVVKVNPNNNRQEKDESKNTKTEVWLESGPWIESGKFTGGSHDDDLNCGGDTFEEAIIKLASLVSIFYNDNGIKRKVATAE